MKRLLPSVSLLLASACAAASPAVRHQLRLSPEQAVMNAATMPQGVSGVFEMVVRSTGRRDGNLYLDSERDYRDPRNLVIVIPDALAARLGDRFGAAPDRYLAGRTIAVKGTARKTRINFIADGQVTDKYYFQTHVFLADPRNLTVSGEQPSG